MSPLLPPGGHDPSEVSLHAMAPQRSLLLHTLMRLAVMISWCYGLGSVQLCAAYETKNSGISNTQIQLPKCNCQQHLCQDTGGSSSSSWRIRPGLPLSPAMALKWHWPQGTSDGAPQWPQSHTSCMSWSGGIHPQTLSGREQPGDG